jgi:hypothetical protein
MEDIVAPQWAIVLRPVGAGDCVTYDIDGRSINTPDEVDPACRAGLEAMSYEL